jgi:GR25 family glycosyltransferase involved in LPS biosynthesis
MRVLNHIIDQKIPIANIFEDDIHFHPNWDSLSNYYYGLTPKDYDILFIGNQLYFTNELPEITKEYWYCMHAYIITLDGAKKLRDMILQYSLENRLCEIDRMIMHVLYYTRTKDLIPPFVSYSWNGTKYPCEHNTSERIYNRNTGLVFQNTNFISEIDDSKIIRNKSTNKKMIMI